MAEQPTTGLYDPSFERDSCGFGLIANLDDEASHFVVETAIAALARLTHRGAVAADGKTGDGCGLLIKFPEAFLREVGTELGFSLNERFAAGTVFLSQDDELAGSVRREIDEAISRKRSRSRRVARGARQTGGLRRAGAKDAASNRAGFRQCAGRHAARHI